LKPPLGGSVFLVADVRRMNLDIDRFSPLKIAVPPHSERKAICRFIAQFEAQVEAAISTYTRQLKLF